MDPTSSSKNRDAGHSAWLEDEKKNALMRGQEVALDQHRQVATAQIISLPTASFSSSDASTNRDEKKSHVSIQRGRKNAQARVRAAKLRELIDEISLKPVDSRSQEEIELLKKHEQRREKKNNRSRERAVNYKHEVERILALPDEERTEEHLAYLDKYATRKIRKNEGDRLRRDRIKRVEIMSGKKPKRVGRPRAKAFDDVSEASSGRPGQLPLEPAPSISGRSGVQVLPPMELAFAPPSNAYLTEAGFLPVCVPFAAQSAVSTAFYRGRQAAHLPTIQFQHPTPVFSQGLTQLRHHGGHSSKNFAPGDSRRAQQSSYDPPPLPPPDASLLQQLGRYRGLVTGMTATTDGKSQVPAAAAGISLRPLPPNWGLATQRPDRNAESGTDKTAQEKGTAPNTRTLTDNARKAVAEESENGDNSQTSTVLAKRKMSDDKETEIAGNDESNANPGGQDFQKLEIQNPASTTLVSATSFAPELTTVILASPHQGEMEETQVETVEI